MLNLSATSIFNGVKSCLGAVVTNPYVQVISAVAATAFIAYKIYTHYTSNPTDPKTATPFSPKVTQHHENENPSPEIDDSLSCSSDGFPFHSKSTTNNTDKTAPLSLAPTAVTTIPLNKEDSTKIDLATKFIKRAHKYKTRTQSILNLLKKDDLPSQDVRIILQHAEKSAKLAIHSAAKAYKYLPLICEEAAKIAIDTNIMMNEACSQQSATSNFLKTSRIMLNSFNGSYKNLFLRYSLMMSATNLIEQPMLKETSNIQEFPDQLQKAIKLLKKKEKPLTLTTPSSISKIDRILHKSKVAAQERKNEEEQKQYQTNKQEFDQYTANWCNVSKALINRDYQLLPKIPTTIDSPEAVSDEEVVCYYLIKIIESIADRGNNCNQDSCIENLHLITAAGALILNDRALIGRCREYKFFNERLNHYLTSLCSSHPGTKNATWAEAISIQKERDYPESKKELPQELKTQQASSSTKGKRNLHAVTHKKQPQKPINHPQLSERKE